MNFMGILGGILGAFLGSSAGAIIGAFIGFALDHVAAPLFRPLLLLTTLAGGLAGSYLASGRKYACMIFALLPWLLYFLASPEFLNVRSRAEVAYIKANMHFLQLGIERYAEDHHGKFPDGVRDRDFDWQVYVPSKLKNRFFTDVQGVANMEPDVKTTGPGGETLYKIARKYSGLGTAGNMRYFVDYKTYSSYAIIGYTQEVKREFFDMGKPKLLTRIIKDPTRTDDNYVLHN